MAERLKELFRRVGKKPEIQANIATITEYKPLVIGGKIWFQALEVLRSKRRPG